MPYYRCCDGKQSSACAIQHMYPLPNLEDKRPILLIYTTMSYEMAEAGDCSVLLCGNSPGQIERPGAEKQGW